MKTSHSNKKLHVWLINIKPSAIDQLMQKQLWYLLTMKNHLTRQNTQQCLTKECIKVIENIYSISTAIIQLYKCTDEIKIGNGVRHEDFLLPKLFTAYLKSIF